MKENAPKRRVISLRWIVSGAAVLLMSVTVLGVGGTAERNARQALNRELEARLLLEARNLALASSGALLSEFPELTLTPILAEIREKQPELAFAVVVDLDGMIRGHADARMIGEKLELPSQLGLLDEGESLGATERIYHSPDLLMSAAPVAHPGGDRIGTAFVALYRSYIDGVMSEARRKQANLLAVLLVAGIIAALVFMSVLLRPVGVLREGLERIGRGDFDTPVRLNDRTELGLLAETMNEMSTRIKEGQEEILEKERLSREVELAREIQSSLLPAGDFTFRNCVIDGAQKAAAEVGGDYYDIFSLPDGKIGLAIADVSGKGLGGCLVTSMLSVLLRAFRESETSPSALLVRLEDRLRDSLRPGTFITMFYGIFDPDTRSLVFSSAGHSPLLVHRAQTRTSEWYKTRGIPLGAVRGGVLAKTLSDEKITLETGDVVVQYTDGINEAFDLAGDEQFGFDRLEKVTARNAAAGCTAVIDAIRGAVAQWAGDQPPLDDETLVVLGMQEGRVASERPAKVTRPAAKSARTKVEPAEVKPKAEKAQRVKRSAPGTPQKAAPGSPKTASGRRGTAAEEKEALDLLESARNRGRKLELTADLEKLTTIRSWLATCPRLELLDTREMAVLESALYEVCANVAEHGYDKDVAKSFELWWTPQSADGANGGTTPGQGVFVVVDRGIEFRPSEANPQADFHDPSVRRRRRGIGLKIIHRAMRRVSYHPGTPVGNVTILGFDPAKIRVEEGVSHG